MAPKKHSFVFGKVEIAISDYGDTDQEFAFAGRGHCTLAAQVIKGPACGSRSKNDCRI
jgi:hypothetical protein